jgi:argininosuccinate lyase
MKALPLAYNRDLQEDKEPLFDSIDTLQLVLPALRGLIETLGVNEQALAARATDGFALATDVAEWLVTQGVAFRQAHEISGRAVALCEKRGITLQELTAEDLASLSPALTLEMVQGLSAESSIAARNGAGGTAPERVAEQGESLRLRLAALRESLAT